MKHNHLILIISIIAVFIIALVLVTNLIIKVKPPAPDIIPASDLLIPDIKEKRGEYVVKELPVREEAKKRPEPIIAPSEKPVKEESPITVDEALNEKRDGYDMPENIAQEPANIEAELEPQLMPMGHQKEPVMPQGELPFFAPVYTRTGPPVMSGPASAPPADINNTSAISGTKPALPLPPAVKKAPPGNPNAKPLPTFDSRSGFQSPPGSQ